MFEAISDRAVRAKEIGGQATAVGAGTGSSSPLAPVKARVEPRCVAARQADDFSR
jgi:hypothetical protein